MLANIIFAGLIPGMMAKPISQRRNATVWARGTGEYAAYPVKPTMIPAASFPVEEPTTYPAPPTTSKWAYSSTSSSEPWSTSTSTRAHSTHTSSSDPVSTYTSTSSWAHSTYISASDPSTTSAWTHSTNTSSSEPWSTSSLAHSTYISAYDPSTTSSWAYSTWTSSSDPSTTSTWAHSSSISTPSPYHSVPTVSTVPAGNQYAVKSSSAPHSTIVTYVTPDAIPSTWVSPVHAAAQTPSAIPFDIESDSEPESWTTPTFAASSVVAVAGTQSVTAASVTAASVTAASEPTEAAVGGQVGHLANGDVPAAESCGNANANTNANTNTNTNTNINTNANVNANANAADEVEEDDSSAASKIKAAQDKAHNHGSAAPVISAEKVSFEACMQSCKGKFQHANIAFDISQGKRNCAEQCARYDSASIAVGVAAAGGPEKRAAPAASPFDDDKVASASASAPGPAVELGAGSVTYESCVRECSFKWQSADLASTDVSQGEQKCAESCRRYVKEGGGVAVEPRAAPVSSPFSPAPAPLAPAAELGAGSVEYEACMRACSSEWQSAGLASSHISQGKQRCEEGCAQAAQEGAGIVVKRAGEHASASASASKSGKAGHAGVGFTTFEACMESCKGKEQHADIAFDISQGKYDCESECASYASAGVNTVVKKGGLPLVGDVLGDATGPSKAPSKAPAKAPSSLAAPPKQATGPGFEAFDGCMSECKGKEQHADIALDISQGKFDCESECARYIKVETGVGARS